MRRLSRWMQLRRRRRLAEPEIYPADFRTLVLAGPVPAKDRACMRVLARL